MKLIVQIKCGSHLYGTATASSDLDVKGVYLPEARDILLQNIKPIISFNRSKLQGEKNTADDVDYELFSPKKFLSLLAEGHIGAWEMLFAPDDVLQAPPQKQWTEIKALAPKLLTKQASLFVRYCRQQANRYVTKGSRVLAVQMALDCFKRAETVHGASAKLALIAEELAKLVAVDKSLRLGEYAQSDSAEVRYFEICGKKVLLSSSLKLARAIAQGLLEGYSERALAAAQNHGIDWKGLSHAVRIGREALEFLSTGHITFPRPEAKYLLDIRLGNIPFQNVSAEIDELLSSVEKAAALSPWPDCVHPSVIDDYIEELHRELVLKEVRE